MTHDEEIAYVTKMRTSFVVETVAHLAWSIASYAEGDAAGYEAHHEASRLWQAAAERAVELEALVREHPGGLTVGLILAGWPLPEKR